MTLSFHSRIFSVVFPRTAVWCYVIASYLGSTVKWSYDKMLIDWVRSGRTGKYLSLGQDARTSLRSVRTFWPRAKYFPVRPSHSVNKYIVTLSHSRVVQETEISQWEVPDFSWNWLFTRIEHLKLGVSLFSYHMLMRQNFDQIWCNLS